MGVMGEDSIVKNAADVVMDVRKMGRRSLRMVRVMACFTSFCLRASLKNRERICTPSEFAIVYKTIGIELLMKLKTK